MWSTLTKPLHRSYFTPAPIVCAESTTAVSVARTRAPHFTTGHSSPLVHHPNHPLIYEPYRCQATLLLKSLFFCSCRMASQTGLDMVGVHFGPGRLACWLISLALCPLKATEFFPHFPTCLSTSVKHLFVFLVVGETFRWWTLFIFIFFFFH